MKPHVYYYFALLTVFNAVPAPAAEPWYNGAAGDISGTVALPVAIPVPVTQDLKCSVCYTGLNKNYTPAAEQKLKVLSVEMAAPGGYTPQEARNYFEAAGKFLAGAGLDSGENAAKQERARLLGIIKKGRFYYGNAVLNVGTGAWDCFTHATRLKEYLEEGTSPAEYKFEIVNGWSDPRKYSAGNLLTANHYMVRAVSLKTGHSYICDGYTGASVKPEQDDKHIVFNEFEECVYKEYLEATLGDGFRRVLAQWTPVQKGLIAINAKSGAGVCLSGAEHWTFPK